MSEYMALYRKWRPMTFDEVVGQEQISETLKNSIKTGLMHTFSAAQEERARPPLQKYLQERSTAKIPRTEIPATNVPPAAEF